MSLPNILTFLRLLLVPVFLTAYWYGNSVLAVSLFVAAAVTDVLDGLLARYAKQQTTLGSILDPLADKILLLSAFILLVATASIPLWALIIVISKEIVVVGGWMLRTFLTRRPGANPSLLGKGATLLQLVTVAAYLVGKLSGPVMASAPYILAAAMVVTALAGIDYLYHGLKELERKTVS